MADPDFPKSCFVSQGEEYILRKNILPSPPLTLSLFFSLNFGKRVLKKPENKKLRKTSLKTKSKFLK